MELCDCGVDESSAEMIRCLAAQVKFRERSGMSGISGGRGAVPSEGQTLADSIHQ